MTEFDKVCSKYVSSEVLEEATKLTKDQSETRTAASRVLDNAVRGHKIIANEPGLRDAIEDAIETDGEFTPDEMEDLKSQYGHLVGGIRGVSIADWITVRKILGADGTDDALQDAGVGMTFEEMGKLTSKIYNSFEAEKRNFSAPSERGEVTTAQKKALKKATELGIKPGDAKADYSKFQEVDNFEVRR
jgi:hypothetical protein